MPRRAPSVEAPDSGGASSEMLALCGSIAAILECPEAETALRLTLAACARLTGVSRAWLAVLRGDGGGPPIQVSLDADGRPRRPVPTAILTARQLEILIARSGDGSYDNRKAPRGICRRLLAPPEVMNHLLAPLRREGSPAGLICLADKPGGFSKTDFLLATSFGALAATAEQKCSLADALSQRVAFATGDLERANAALQRQVLASERAQRSLGEEHAFRKAIEDSLVTGVIACDRRGRLVHANHAFCRMTGWKERELLGMAAPHPFWPPEDVPRLRKAFREVLAGEAPAEGHRVRFLRRNGERFPARVIASRLRSPRGAPSGWVASVGDITRQERTEAALRESAAELRRLSAQLLSVEERERKRISRELHDSLGQTLSALKYSMEEALAECSACPGSHAASRKLVAAITVLGTIIEEVRAIVADLRPSMLDDLGLISAIRWFCREFAPQRRGIRIVFRFAVKEKDVPEPLKITIFRLLQEAMHNAARHSGADRVLIRLTRRKDRLSFAVEDNGRGIERVAPPPGVGIIGMRERTELSGGTFSLASEPGKGTVVRAVWPLPVRS